MEKPRFLITSSPESATFLYTPNTRKDKLDVWPPFPLIVVGNTDSSSRTDNIVAALEEHNRVCYVMLDLASQRSDKVLAAMQVPFPELTYLNMGQSFDELLLVDPLPDPLQDSFLGGSAPSLRHFSLSDISFPGLSNLLLSANHLVSLELELISPRSGYISHEAMVALISALSSLETLSLGCGGPKSRPEWEIRSLPLPKRSILPALNKFHFKGFTEYLENLVTRIDTPQLNILKIKLFNQNNFDCARLAQFINCTPTLRALDKARAQIEGSFISVKLRCWTSQSGPDYLDTGSSCIELDWEYLSFEQICHGFYPLSTVKDLYVKYPRYVYPWQNRRDNGLNENTIWLQLLLPFTAVKNLYLSKEFVPGIAAALQELVEGRLLEALPGLQNIFVDWPGQWGFFQTNIEPFVAARRLSNRPIVISEWDLDKDSGM